MAEPATTDTATLPRTCRILYFGPPECGKSANLRHIGDCVPINYRVPVPAPAAGERLAFRVDGGELGSWLVIAEAVDPVEGGDDLPARDDGFAFDGVVFVADSSADRLDYNLSALESLRGCLESAGLDFTSVPMVIQFNKQDAPGSLPLAQLESLLNPWGLPSFTAVATRGVGVRETLRAVLGTALRQLDRRARGETGSDDEPAAGAESGHDDETPEAGVDLPSVAGGTPVAAPAVAPTVAPTANPAAAAAPARPGHGDRFPALVAPQPLQIESQSDDVALFAERRPPVVVPVRVPRSLLERHGTVRVVLEIELDEKGTGLL